MKPTDTQQVHILPEGTVLPNNYIINRILGEGGFGITYSGTLSVTGEKVAIKEYFPTGLAHRTPTTDTPYQVIPYYGMEDSFEKGRRHFLNEAIILKEFQNLNSIVSVKDVIETNGTVYLVMEYIDGITLKQYVQENGALTFEELLPLIKPVILSLIQIHKQGLIHRDISPENLMIGIDNQLHLIDFGAASTENGHAEKTMTVILKSGYAPPEQYLSDGKQGAWTDIYALCATMYMTLTGFAPPESIRRIQQEELPPLASHANISSWQAAAIEKGMNLIAAERFQNMESFYQALIIPPLEILSNRNRYRETSIEDNKTVMKHNAGNKKSRKLFFAILLVAFLFVAFFSVGTLLDRSNSDQMENRTAAESDSDAISDVTSNSASDTSISSTSENTEENLLCSMINVVGFSLTDAKAWLGRLDDSIQINTTWVYDETQPANAILKQSIQEGTDFTRGSLGSILLTVSRGKEVTTETTTEAPVIRNDSENKKSGSSQTKTTTSEEDSTNENDIKVSPIEDDYETITFN